MTATMRAGHFPPSVTSITPNSGNSGAVVGISEVRGSGLVHGATFVLRDGMTEYPAMTSAWVGKTKLAGTVDLEGVPTGQYDVVVRNPDGQEAVLTDGFTVGGTVPVFIREIHARVVGSNVELTWEVWSEDVVEGYRILRREADAPLAHAINHSLIEASSRSYIDNDTRPGVGYEYFLVVVLNDGSELRSQTVGVKTTGYALELYQNTPNPFNPSTRIRYSLPNQAHVRLEIYDPLGKRVARLVDGVRDAGPNEAVWNGTGDSGAAVASGVYFYRLSTGRQVLTKKLLLLK
jgi:hypothetical protein